MTHKLLLSISEVANAFGVGRRTAYVLRSRPGFPPAITLASRVIRYRAADVAEFVARLAAEAAPAPEPPQLAATKPRRSNVNATGAD